MQRDDKWGDDSMLANAPPKRYRGREPLGSI
jgi:hypothetical protein